MAVSQTRNTSLTPRKWCLAHLLWGVYLGRLCGLYLMTSLLLRVIIGPWGEQGVKSTRRLRLMAGKSFALSNQPSHTSGCGDGKNLRYITAHPIIVERAGTSKAGYQRVRCPH